MRACICGSVDVIRRPEARSSRAHRRCRAWHGRCCVWRGHGLQVESIEHSFHPEIAPAAEQLVAVGKALLVTLRAVEE